MDLHVEEFGTGGAPLVLLHGLGIPPSHLVNLATNLAKSRRVLMIHLPGYGRSAPLPSGQNVLDDANALVEVALVDRRVEDAYLVGYSLGAYRALALACSSRLRPRGVVCLGGFAFRSDVERAMFSQAVALAPPLDQLVEMFIPGFFAPGFPGRNPGAIAVFRAWARELDRDTIFREIESQLSCLDLRPSLTRLPVPVSACQGTSDGMVQPDAGREILRATGQLLVRYREFPAVGHGLLFEAPEETLRFVLEMTTE